MRSLLEAQFALAYKGIVDAGSVGRMDMRHVMALKKRLDDQLKAEADQIQKARKEAAARRRN